MRRGFFVWAVAVLLAAAAGGVWPGLPDASAQATQQEQGVSADLERGEKLFAFCTQCHGPAGGGNAAIEAPPIAGLPDWYVEKQLQGFRQGWRGGHPEDIAGMRMRPMSLWLAGDEDVTHVSAYVASLPATDPAPTLEGGDPTRGQALYGPCLACHGPDGSGNAAIGSPPLTGMSDWYLLSQLQKFKARIRGWSPEDTNGQVMVGMAGTLADEQAMKDVVAHIMTLGSR